MLVPICVHSICIISPTQILRVLAAPTQLVLATTSHITPPLKSKQWRSCSGAHGGAPVPSGVIVCLSHPRAHIQIYHPLDTSLPQEALFLGYLFPSSLFSSSSTTVLWYTSYRLSASAIKDLGSTNWCWPTGAGPYAMPRSHCLIVLSRFLRLGSPMARRKKACRPNMTRKYHFTLET